MILEVGAVDHFHSLLVFWLNRITIMTVSEDQ
jgi:hypothetical protein